MESNCTNKRIGQLIALYEFDGLDKEQQRRFLNHLVECDYCYAEVYSLEPMMAVFRDHRIEARKSQAGPVRESIRLSSPSRPVRSWRLIPAFAALSVTLIAAVIGVYIVSQSSGSDKGNEHVKMPQDGDRASLSPWRDIEVPKAAYTRPKQGDTLRGPRNGLDRAMAAYEAGDFAGAIELFESLRETKPAVALDVNFYLGVSLLEVGRSEDAVPPLRQVVDSSTGPQLEAAHYYLGLAYLKKNEPKQAVAELDAVIEMKGEYFAAASKLRREVFEHM